MTPSKFYWKPAILGILSLLLAVPAFASEEPKEQAVYPVAILPFADRQKKNDDVGKIVADTLFAHLAGEEAIMLVDREDLDKVLEEQGVNISGVVDSAGAVKVGNIIGAKILITGSVLRTDSSRYLVAKIIGTETTRVFGASVKGDEKESVGELAEKLGEKVREIILKEGGRLVAPVETREDGIARIKESLKDKTLPTLTVTISESHVGRQTVDPAAETEMRFIAMESGFTVFEKQAEVEIRGEAFSEYAATHGNLISVKARVEVKAVDVKTGEIVASDSQTAVAVDLTEQIAAKRALQQAGAGLAERVLLKIVR